jgi:hypothetical protein
VIAGAAQVLLTILGITLAIKLLPAIPLPDVDLPRIDLPDLPLPTIDLPDIALPDWLREFLATKPYWFPVALGGSVALRELRKRRQTAD